MAGRQFGKYQLDRELGRGPLGKVYAAKNLETNQLVVFRGFQRPKDADETRWNEAIRRFHSKLDQAKKLDHPHIANVYEFGVRGSLYYIVTEYFEGQTVRQIIDSDHTPSIDKVTSIVTQCCEVIDHAAAQGMNHGDLTPYNILVLADGNIRVINYGLAHTRNRLGSAHLAPEQLNGSTGDHRSDIFSLGTIAYALLSGTHAFHGQSVEELCRNIQSAQPRPLVGFPAYLQGIIFKMFAKTLSVRYPSGSEVIRDLENKKVPAGFAKVDEKPEAVLGRSPWERNYYQPPPSLGEYKLDEGDLAEARERIRQRRLGWIRLSERVTLRIAVALFMLVIASTIADSFKASRSEVAMAVLAAKGSPQVCPVKLKDDNIWIPLRRDDWINQGDAIRTNAGDTTALEMRDGTRLELAPNTDLKVTTMQFRRRSASKVREFALTRGRVWARVRHLHGKHSKFEIASGGATVRVTGTSIGVQTAGEDKALFATYSGTSAVVVGKQSTPLPAGKALGVTEGQIAGKIDSIPDKDLKRFANLANLHAAEPFFVKLRQALIQAEERVLLPTIGAVTKLKDLEPEDTNKEFFNLQHVGGIAKATTAMRAISMTLETCDEYPEEIGLTDLTGIGMDDDPKWRKTTLQQFSGERLLSYERTGKGYTIKARANTRAKQLIICENGRVEVIEEEQAAKQQ